MPEKIRRQMASYCELCGECNDLHIHHKDRNRKNNRLSNLITLCRSCHAKEHQWQKNFNHMKHLYVTHEDQLLFSF